MKLQYGSKIFRLKVALVSITSNLEPETLNCSSFLPVPDDLETVDVDRLTIANACFTHGDRKLIFNRVNPFQVGKKQTAFTAALDDNAILHHKDAVADVDGLVDVGELPAMHYGDQDFTVSAYSDSHGPITVSAGKNSYQLPAIDAGDWHNALETCKN